MTGLSRNAAKAVADRASPIEPNRFLARQPILDRQRRIIGYELLFRSGWTNSFSGEPEDATRQMLDNILVLGADALSAHTLAFVNCTRNCLVHGLVTLLPPSFTVLEILEAVRPDDEVIAACRSLKKLGYHLALDDFVLSDGMDELVDLADYIKIDFRASNQEDRSKIRASLRGSRAALLAEKVEDEAEFETATAEGYSHFQGYFFCRPAIIARRELPSSRLNALQLLTALSRPFLDLSEIERAVMANAALCYRLLRLVNSPRYAIRDRVQSIKSALMIVGDDEFRKLAFIALATTLSSHRPHPIVSVSLQRARFCELMAPVFGLHTAEQYLVGLLSVADAILEIPMATIVEALPLRPAIRSALLGQNNEEAQALSAARHYETGDWNCLPEADRPPRLNLLQMTRVYAESAQWTDKTLAAYGNLV